MDRVEEKFKLLKPVLPFTQWNGLRIRYTFESDFRKRQEIETLLDMLIAQKVPGLPSEQILLPPPESTELTGDYPIGNVVYPDRSMGIFGIRTQEWIRHCGIFGKTGSGKTTLTVNIIRELVKKDHPFLIFDYKRNYRDLIKQPEFTGHEILIFTVGRNEEVPFYFNPKQSPEGIEAYVWTKQLSQLIEKVYFLGLGAADVLMENADEKTFKEMHQKVLKQKKKARELLWWASVKRTLNAINYPGLGEMVNCEQGYSIPDLLKKKVILELDGLSACDQAFVIGTLLLWIYHYRMRQPEREILKHFMIIEEAHHLFLKTRQEEDIADVIMREIRELGEAMIIIDQHPSKMSVSALGNLSTKFALAMSLNQDVQAIANAMLLDPNQKKYLSMLTIGQAICRSDRLATPILLSIPHIPLRKGLVTDEDVKSHMRGYLQDLQAKPTPLVQPSTIRTIPKRESLSPLGRIMLENIAQKPIIGVVKRFRELGLKPTQGYQVIDELITHQLVKPCMIDRQKLYDLTSIGKKILGKKFALNGRGGLEHRYFVEKIKHHYLNQEGFTFVEKDNIDLVVESYHRSLAIQVETGKSDIHSNLIKLAQYKADQKYMLATNKAAEIKIREMFDTLIIPDKSKIQINYVKDFINNPPAI
ncbi:putative protein DUF87 [Desulfosarcina variabilis str. Montpellier]|uniref:ATP-binding protein n=1 Tax=Desulfosarcina variabilis TaxID=2300 RepID=UPI003AFB1EB8